jgi:hypothetical protein
MRPQAGPLAFAAAFAAAAACLPGSGQPLQPYTDDASAPPQSLGNDAGDQRLDVDLGAPFQVSGLQPSHGPWNGGTRATLRGRGFSSKLTVSIGGVLLDPSAVFASDPLTAAVLTPPGAPGPADVTIRDDSKALTATLPAGFFYDSFVLEPNSGATSGGTRVALTGSGTHWVSGTTVAIDGKACTSVTVADNTHLQCLTPKDTQGTKDVLTTDPDGTVLQAREAYTYDDSFDGYRGGLSGGALAGNLTVLVLDSWLGEPIPGAYAIAQTSTGTLQARTDSGGVAGIADPSLTGAVTVTVAAHCHSPMTFAAVPVDTVTAYIDPRLDPSCEQGDPPSTGNGQGPDAGEVDGELVWQGGVEFERAPWLNVPNPATPDERQAAYVFVATGSSNGTFQLPQASAATTNDSPGQFGYGYSLPVSPGNLTLYALAGIENRKVTPPRFTAYAMGVVRGVSVTPATKVVGVDIPMQTLLDHAVTIAPVPPSPQPRGPDTFVSLLSVTLGASAYAVFPTGQAQMPLPVAGNVVMSGVPSLDSALSGQSYILTAGAVTGPNWAFPASIIQRFATTDSNQAIAIGGFLPVPALVQPSDAAWSGTHLTVNASGAWDLMLVDVESGGGLATWTIVAPAGVNDFALPDLSALQGDVGLVRGVINASAYVARITPFDYGKLRWGQMGTGAWYSYAGDSVTGSY